MSVLDYAGTIYCMSPYQRMMAGVMLEELLEGEDSGLFSYLDDVSLDDMDIYWYFDRDWDVLGGFYYLSGNCMYLNVNGIGSCWGTDGVDLRYLPFDRQDGLVLSALPTMMHELRHYWQSRKYWWAYPLLQLPVVREFTIEKAAYAVSDRLYDLIGEKFDSAGSVAEMKIRRNVPDFYITAADRILANRFLGVSLADRPGGAQTAGEGLPAPGGEGC